jgi:hypothetical protein
VFILLRRASSCMVSIDMKMISCKHLQIVLLAPILLPSFSVSAKSRTQNRANVSEVQYPLDCGDR